MSNPADICRECELSGNPKLAKAVEMLDRFDNLLQKEINKNAELLQKVQLLEESIEGLIKAVNESNFCSTCSEELGNLACSECPWHQAKEKAIRLLAKEE